MNDDDDERLPLTGFIPMGDQDRRITQEEIDRSAAFTEPLLRIFNKIPDELAPAVMSSVLLSWCLKFQDPEEALAWLSEQWRQALPSLQASRTATRQ